MTLLDFPTELLFQILSHLSPVDLCTAQRICRRINRIITDSVQFQYILCAHINGVEDLLPSDCSFHDRLNLLQCHEKSWNNLQFNKYADFPVSAEVSDITNEYILRDGYLIYRAERRYGYIDLCSAIGNKEVTWVHIPMEHSDMHHLDFTFAVDQDLTISYSNSRSWRPGNEFAPFMLGLFEFTTGTPHPLSSMHIIRFPISACRLTSTSLDIEVLGGDYILVLATYTKYVDISYCHSEPYLYLLSWKTGVVTHLRTFTDHPVSGAQNKPFATELDNNVVALAMSSLNSLEICKLEITPLGPHLQTLCFLELPPLMPNIRCVITRGEKEWIPTSKRQEHSQSSRRRLVPFRSSTIRSVLFSLTYTTTSQLPSNDFVGMIISVAALLSEMPSDCGNESIPWAQWGPAATHIFPLKRYGIETSPAGPFWILEKSPLVIRAYDPLSKGRAQSTAENASSLSRSHWVGGKVETHLPYHDVIGIGDHYHYDIDDGGYVLLDRGWFVSIWHREGSDIADVRIDYTG